jgi:hypothetical protein
MESTYYARAEGSKVTICPRLLNDRSCPQPAGMLRQKVDTGEVVLLPQSCTPRRVAPHGVADMAHKGACYLDECVPPGTYRYGFARPLECVGDAAHFYAQVAVTQPLDKSCKRSSAEPSPRTHVPWGDSPYVCIRSWSMAGMELSWGLILLLVMGTSFVLVYRKGRRGR